MSAYTANERNARIAYEIRTANKRNFMNVRKAYSNNVNRVTSDMGTTIVNSNQRNVANALVYVAFTVAVFFSVIAVNYNTVPESVVMWGAAIALAISGVSGILAIRLHAVADQLDRLNK